MNDSNDITKQIRDELQNADPRDLPAIKRYTQCVKENKYQRRERLLLVEKLRLIRSPWKRFVISTALDILIVTAPIRDDQFDRDWSAARNMRITAEKRLEDFFALPLRASKRYRRMYFMAMLITWKNAARLYGVALMRALKNTVALAYS